MVSKYFNSIVFVGILTMFFVSCNEASSPKRSNDLSVRSEQSLDEVLLVDVRTQAEYDSGHLEDAIHIHFQEIADKIANYTTDKDKKIIVYCASGARSGMAERTLNAMGYRNVENGINMQYLKRQGFQ